MMNMKRANLLYILGDLERPLYEPQMPCQHLENFGDETGKYRCV